MVLPPVLQCESPPIRSTAPVILDILILGADEAGSATVNQIAARHYTFDARALALNDGRAYTGELWVAADGGYLVKYNLSSKGGPDIYGDGVEGTMTWEYNLTDVNQPATIGVPKGCPPGQLDVPEMPGAETVVKSVGLLSFDMPSATIDDVLAYYKDKLTANGWAAERAPLIEPGQMGSASFTKGDLEISVIVWISDGKTSVSLSLSSAIPEEAN